MKNLIIAFIAVFPFLVLGQTAQQTSQPKHFRSADKQYNDWSAYVFGGTSLIQTGDLTSINNGVGDWNFGYDFSVGVNKSINHAFGLIFQYQNGETKQEYVGTYQGRQLHGKTKYQGFAVMGDLNLTTLFRRFDNKSQYLWALHAYVGVGMLGYKAYSNAHNADLSTPTNPIDPHAEIVVNDESAGLGSFYSMMGMGLKYKISRRIDLEARVMYHFTGDEEFDGSGDPIFAGGTHIFSPADIEEQRHDNFITAGLGLNVKFGKHPSHLMWEYWPPQPIIDVGPTELCESGDGDQDGVCDDWDKCLDTPLGARIDGSGCALDTDLDGIIDLYDECVTLPGTAELKGCPEVVDETFGFDERGLKGVEFALDSDELRPVSYPILDNAANIIIKYAKGRKFYVEGYTDTRASEEYNLKLSQARVETVVDYLVGKGVPRDQLIPVGKGETNLLYPECQDAEKCRREGNEWKNEANRRVVFVLVPEGQ